MSSERKIRRSRRPHLECSSAIRLEDPGRALEDHGDVICAELLQVANGRSDLLLGVVLIVGHPERGARVSSLRKRTPSSRSSLSQELDSLLVHVFAVVEIQ